MLGLKNLYWVVFAAVVAVITHIVTLVFVPGMVLARSLDGLVKEGPTNQFYLLTREAQRKLFPDFPADAIFGVCRFNLSDGPVALNANLPASLWTLTVYSRTGKTLYTVNDLQSGASTFNLQLEKAPGLIESFTAKPDDDLVASSGWKVKSADTDGLALFWVPGNDPAMRRGLSETLAKSSCGRVSG